MTFPSNDKVAALVTRQRVAGDSGCQEGLGHRGEMCHPLSDMNDIFHVDTIVEQGVVVFGPRNRKQEPPPGLQARPRVKYMI